MGFWDKVSNAVSNFDYEGAANTCREAMERKQESIERRAHNEFRQRAKNASDYELQCYLRIAEDSENYILEEEVRKEMERRGLY